MKKGFQTCVPSRLEFEMTDLEALVVAGYVFADGYRVPARCGRPALVLELLSGTHADPGAVTKGICDDFGYEAFLVTRESKVPALPAIASLGSNSTYDTQYETRNVLFVAK